MNTNFDPRRGGPQGVIAQVVAVIVGVLALGAAFMFSLVVFAVVAVAGLGFWLYFWWKTRAVRKAFREQMEEARNMSSGGDFRPGQTSGPQAGGDIIEGESVRVVEPDQRLEERDNRG